jgi:glycosyltransferase involved in cell wall biosynthesis
MLSIITPVLNGSFYIESTICSINKLKIDYEHIIVDGGSTDSTLDIIKKYPNVKLIRQQEKLGMYHAIDLGINIAKGDFITWVNSDDKIILYGFEQMYKEICKEGIDFVFSNGVHHYINDYSYKTVTALPFARYFLKEGIFPFVQPSSIFSKKSYQSVGGFNYQKFKIIGDRDLFQKMAYDSSITMKYVPVLSSVFLRHDETLLYRSLDRLEKEHSFTIKTNKSIFIRILYHTFRVIKNEYWNLKIKKI